MKAVLTRVSSASVAVDGDVVGKIVAPETGGILALVGVSVNDADDAAAWQKMAKKIAELRILDGEKSVTDLDAPVLVVSQFTLYGQTAKGRRPSWSQAAPAEIAEPIINSIVEDLRGRGLEVATGRFGAMMEVSSVNQGPFTVLVET
ncbi:D-aminoacyl-tRNA deacylase [Corynebacterium sp. MNWGS58]|uniref:D-aminoacyl-tRNA deacylase n=1 Tax=Corynebacterium sp. 102791.4 TaxID=3104612 RepID=UPI003512B927